MVGFLLFHGSGLQQSLLAIQWQSISLLQAVLRLGENCLAQNQHTGIKVHLSLISQPEVVSEEKERDRAFPGAVQKVHGYGT